MYVNVDGRSRVDFCVLHAAILCHHNINLSLPAPAVIVAVTPSYISIIGSNVTLRCDIINKGTPQASFSWRRNGNEINDDKRISVNDTAMSLTLINITMESSGRYFCIGTSVVSHRSDTVELIVEGMLSR